MDTSAVTHLQPAHSVEEAPLPSPVNRFGPRWLNRVKALFGTPSQRRLARAALQLDRIRYWEKEYDRLSDPETREAGLRLRGRARGGESLDKLLPEAFGLVCVASARLLKMRPFDVQLAGGVVRPSSTA